MRFHGHSNDEESAKLRKKLFYSGLIILLAGLTFLAVGSFRNVKLETVTKISESWMVSEDLMEGDTYVLDVMSSYQWRDDYTDGYYETPQPVDLMVISPNGGITNLQAFFLARLPTSEWQKSTFPSLVSVEYGSVDSDSLEVDESYPQVRFTVKQGGYYTAIVREETLNWTRGPPRELVLYREVFENQNLYTIFLSTGLVCFFTGFIVSVRGAATVKKTRIKQKKKIERQK